MARLKGQEIEVRFIADGVMQEAFACPVSFDDNIKTELKEQGYLGEKTNRHDEVYNGTDFNLKMHVQSNKWMAFQKLVTDRAQRITPATVINIIRSDFYSDGSTGTRIYPDVHFGPMPSSGPSRTDYVDVSLTGACDQHIDDVSTIL